MLEQIQNGRGQITNLVYDAAGRLVQFTDPAGIVSYTYDANGNILTVTDGSGTISREFDALNRVTKYTDARGNTIRYAYDPVGNLTTLTYPDGKQVHYGYDAANRLTSVTDWAGRVTGYEYDANGRLIKTTRPNGTVETRQYDIAGQLLQINDVDGLENLISQYDFTYDAAGNILTEEDVIGQLPFNPADAIMTYAADNRLESYNSQLVGYDADGNMIFGPLAGTMGNYAFDARNRLTAAGDTSYQYGGEPPYRRGTGNQQPGLRSEPPCAPEPSAGQDR